MCRNSRLTLLIQGAFKAVSVTLLTTVYVSGCGLASHYSGDGKFESINDAQRFRIRFEKFNMSDPFHAKYTVAGYPDPTELTIALWVFPQQNDRRYMKGTLSLKVVEESGKALLSCNGPLEEWPLGEIIWEDRLHGDEFYAHSNGRMIQIPGDVLKTSPSLTLSVDYEPTTAKTGIPPKLTGSLCVSAATR